MPSQSRKPVVRRYGRLIVRLTAAGIELRGYRKKKWRAVTWNEVAWLTMTNRDQSRLFCELEGKGFLERIGATT